MKVRLTFNADHDLRCAITFRYSNQTDKPASRREVEQFFADYGNSTIDDVMSEWQAAVEGSTGDESHVPD